MLLNAVATVVLSAMMLVPLVNVVVGAVVGGGVAGPLGTVAGTLFALLVTLAEKIIGDRRGWFRVRNTAVGAEPVRRPINDGLPAGGALAVTEGDGDLTWEEIGLGGEFEAQLIDDEVRDSQWAQFAFSGGFNHAEQIAVNCT